MGRPSFDLHHPGRRVLEIATGSVAWVLISAPIWAAFLAPDKLSYFLLLFNGFWLYKTATTAVCGAIGLRRLGGAQRTDWLGLCQSLGRWNHMHHLVVIPTYGEPAEVLETSLSYLAQQDYPHENIWVVLAFEARDPQARERSVQLLSRFQGQFAGIWATFHQDRPGEVRGKSSNLAHAVRWAKERLVDELGLDPRSVLVTVCDADSRLHARYCSALTFQFLTDEDGHRRIFQPALMFYANVWRIPPVVRIMAGMHSVWQLSRLVTPYKLINQSTYSLSLATCHQVGYWDPDVIPEDSRMFFKVLFALGDGVRVTPIFLPVYADAAEGSDWLKTLVNHYKQMRRWAWGVSDVPYLIWRLMRSSDLPLRPRLVRAAMFSEEHITWPTHWFLLTLGAQAPALLAPAFTVTPLGQSLSALAQLALTLCLPCLAVIMWIDHELRPSRPEPSPWWRTVLSVASWAMLPVAGLLFTAIPALDAHTRLLFGQYLQYQVTEKHAGDATLVPDWSGGAEAA